ncbi:glycosyltransferase [Leptodesmis sichuanensis]|uniref:glycosyltransferase n=1 Tax=Leptodesmis sichuanensis TaxID=2906798 RepID=UPI001F2DD9DD|nr:hypothetical protein [Leptodesmis sichuanensis]UIE37511.1 hypothetical protein KIK02_21650 [Leptodesmis sichuanensis A121]
MVPIYFYFPKNKLLIKSLPENASSYWQWQCAQESISPMQSGGCFWTLQTYLYLNDYGFPCQLVDTLPDEGIVVSHRDYLDASLQPGFKVLLVCLRADVDRHPYAQLHVVQNPYQAITKGFMRLWESHFIPHWPQPSIIPRPSDRGDIFENVMFLGNAVNLVPEFRELIWYEELEKLGLKFRMKLKHDEWHDYSDTDVVLAIRELGQTNNWRGKPASKLYSAWHAGVPAILGYESAFRAERKSDLDYLEATTLTEVIAALKQLKEDRELRSAMVKNGRMRAAETNPDNMVKRWQTFLTEVTVPAYESWCGMSSWQQQIFFNARWTFINSRPAYYNLKPKLLTLIGKN